MKSETFWDGVATSYAKRPMQNLDQHERTIERAASYLSAESEVLEVGCGTGTIALKLARFAKHIFAVDVSGALLAIARERAQDSGASNVSFARHDIADLPKGQFDAVMAFNVLHLLADMPEAVKQLASRTKPGGVVVTKTGVLGQTWQGQLLRPVIGLMRLVGKAPFVGFYSNKDVENAMKGAGLEVIEAENMGGKISVRFLVARKIE